METKVLKIRGMSCAHCEKAVTEALQAVQGVESVQVDLDGGKATVRIDPSRATDEALKAAIEDAGYEVTA